MRLSRLIAVLVLLIPSVTYAKHPSPGRLAPVINNGIRYVVPNDRGLRGYVEAWDLQSGQKLWAKTIFRHWYVPIPFGPTECMRYEYLQSMIHQSGRLLLTSDRGRVYELDMRTRSVRRVKLKKPYKTLETNPDSASLRRDRSAFRSAEP